MLSFEQCFILCSSFPFLLAFHVGGLGLEFCVFVAGWGHALRSEWSFYYYYYHCLLHAAHDNTRIGRVSHWPAYASVKPACCTRHKIHIHQPRPGYPSGDKHTLLDPTPSAPHWTLCPAHPTSCLANLCLATHSAATPTHPGP